MPRPVMPMPGALPVAEPVVAPEPEPMDEFADIRARGSLVGLVDGKELWRLETRYHYIPTEAEALAASEREIARQKALKKAEEK